MPISTDSRCSLAPEGSGISIISRRTIIRSSRSHERKCECPDRLVAVQSESGIRTSRRSGPLGPHAVRTTRAWTVRGLMRTDQCAILDPPESGPDHDARVPHSAQSRRLMARMPDDAPAIVLPERAPHACRFCTRSHAHTIGMDNSSNRSRSRPALGAWRQSAKRTVALKKGESR